MHATIETDGEAVGLIRAIALAAGAQDDRLRAVDEASHALLASLEPLPHHDRLDRLRAICDGCARETDAFRANQMPAAAEVMERSGTILRQGL